MNNTYNTKQPNIDCLLTHDEVYFEGIRRPLIVFTAEDSSVGEQQLPVLERYIGDVHNLFLKKFADFYSNESVSNEEAVKLQALLQEMVKVKKLIEGIYEERKNTQKKV